MPDETAVLQKQWPAFIKQTESGWYLSLKVQPGAKKNELCKESAGTLRLRLTAPAVDNKANTALIDFVAEILQIKKSRLKLVSGEKSRIKKLFIQAGAAPFFSVLL
ncbi:MAG: DUF167 domain-containing protein [Deltaproteobacteria bacterium]|jgi:uncharacterized protein (TIGR00251 family)|nr:DUF167 domain-containing protein [Deltaproteobacteria bacterium]